MNLGLQNRRVLVSGGSRGIGKAIVQCFLDEGAQVAFCARSASGVAEAEQAFGDRAFGAVVDVTQPAQVQHWIANAVQRLGGLDIIVPNVSALAGGSDLDTWRKAFDTDLLGSVAMVQAALPHLLQSDAASVVLISSVSGREVDMFAEPYGVLKAALLHYAKTLSARHAADGIRVNSVSPGNVYFAEGVWGDIERNDPQTFAQSLAANPMGRMATPEEVARATVFLASPAASFTTGTSLLVDGGLTKAVQF
ncbi:SDR family NAD(P)-dependent oxidoreductase [Pseudomonas poae]|uniref:3-ketoacyl-ACP reductase n=1 Tax=Pseudomonas poae TaxID=200451 RepID=A0A2S9EJ92_9PSED|nr:SDR family oxidoreductase [Pseudomonas poae]PRA26210.1 3-ketoacyl-ACP reductase [Pseudomonas poae]PRC15375.1 3-ketoacyl-ACP reductase [Pseudomonas poae]